MYLDITDHGVMVGGANSSCSGVKGCRLKSLWRHWWTGFSMSHCMASPHPPLLPTPHPPLLHTSHPPLLPTLPPHSLHWFLQGWKSLMTSYGCGQGVWLTSEATLIVGVVTRVSGDWPSSSPSSCSTFHTYVHQLLGKTIRLALCKY